MGKFLAYFGTNLSPALLGVGYIVGLNIGIVVLAGSVISWNIAIPIFHATQMDAHPELAATIAGVTEDLEALRFNTAISKLMVLVRHLTREAPLTRPAAEALVLLLSPLAPHVAEELWRQLGHRDSLAYEPWPEADPAHLVRDTLTLAVQVNGKWRDEITVPADAGEEALQRLTELPGGQKAVSAFNDLRNRVDELGKKVRGIDALEARVTKLEKDLAALKKSSRKSGSESAGA